DLSALDAGKMTFEMVKYSLSEIIGIASTELEPLAKAKGVALEIGNGSSPTTVVCDVNRIRQVVGNLLSNAIKFTPKGSKVQLSFKPGKLPLDPLQSDKTPIPAILVQVSDQGIGVPESELESIFDKFVQSSKTSTGAGGRGLGLAICKEIVRAHHGIIWAENNPEGGSTFSIVIPVEQQTN
ncbi:MAG: HAMP domain-containing histidine kinase, partial [Proteobacteria bacterium]|nr:HAMP domain-containing histidine kinase [Pseudomonadota bacterium]